MSVYMYVYVCLHNTPATIASRIPANSAVVKRLTSSSKEVDMDTSKDSITDTIRGLVGVNDARVENAIYLQRHVVRCDGHLFS
jgi:hypothetical protein